ncbi:MAG: right-handed parallel beta-helix repeat-containing protein, partial [bacterium]
MDFKKLKTGFLFSILLAAFNIVYSQTILTGILPDSVMTSAGNPYLVQGDVTIVSSSTWTIGEGVIFKFSDGTQISGNDIKFVVNGTAANPVYFTSVRDDSVGNSDDNGDGDASYGRRGRWDGIFLSQNSKVTMKHAHFKYGGADNGNNDAFLYLNAADTSLIDSSVFEMSEYHALHFENCAAKVTLNACSLRSNGQYGIYVRDADSTAIKGCWFHDNDYRAVYIGNGNTDMSSPNFGDTAVTGTGLNRFFNNAFGNFYTNVSPLVTLKAENNYWSDTGSVNQDIDIINGSFTIYNAHTYTIKPVADPDLHPPAQPGSFTAAPGATGGTIKLSWISPQEDTGASPSGKPAKSYLIKYDTVSFADINNAAFTAVVPKPLAPGAAEEFYQVNLIADTMYYFGIQAQDEYGNAGQTAFASARTGTGGAGTNVSDTIIVNTTWTVTGSPYYITEYYFAVNEGCTLSIEPGVLVKYRNDRFFDVKGTIIAKGTAAAPIIFTSANAADGKGSNIGMQIFNTAAACTLSHCVFEKGGRSSWANLTINSQSGTDRKILIDSCVFQNGTSYGLNLGKMQDLTVYNCSFNNFDNAAIGMSMGCGATFSNISAANCWVNGYSIKTGSGNNSTGGDSVQISWLDKDLYYRFGADYYTVTAGDTLNIGPGVTVKWERTYTSRYLTVNGLLRAVGTGTEPILWTTDTILTPSNGNSRFAYIRCNNSTDSSLFVNNIFEKTDNQYGTIWCESSSPAIDSCIFRNSMGWGIYLSSASKPRIQNCTFTGNFYGAIYVGNTSTLQSDPLVGNNTAYGNGYNGIRISRDNHIMNSVWEADNIPYDIRTYEITVKTANTLTIEPGARIYMQDKTYNRLEFIINGRLDAVGTAAKPI